MEELTNTMQLLFSSGDEQSGNDFHCPERFQCWDSARLIHTGYTLSNIYSLLHIWRFSICCACVSSQVCISIHAQFVFKFVCTSVFKFIFTRVCGSVCWFSVGAGNQEGTIDPWRVGGKRGRRQEEWLKKNPSNQRAGIGIIDNKGCKKDANSLCACLFSDEIRWKGLT